MCCEPTVAGLYQRPLGLDSVVERAPGDGPELGYKFET
jgi:hypothetical protein